MGLLDALFRKKEVAVEEKKPAFTEKRKAPRTSISESTFIYSAGRPPAQIRLTEISMSGVRFEAREPFKPGSKLELALYAGGIVVKSIITVLWERKDLAGYTYGGEFAGNDPKQRAHIQNYIKSVVKS
ncbi:MAG: PilZ domain-containing protein [Candidatus Eremiobacteraeota bacterium]|nr:PilZ domain-containing protein [Candidatus Eremiobacteraeota bacterium]